LRGRELVAHGGLRIAAELGVPERVVADLVALARPGLELAAGQVRLVEEIVRSRGSRQHVEGRGVPEARVLAREGLEDADAARGIDHPLGALLDVPELPGRGVIEGEDDRAGARGQRDLAVEVIGEGDGAIAALPEPAEVALEVL